MVKNMKIKKSKIINEDVSQVKKLIVIFVIVVCLCVGLYFLTNNMIEKENKKSDKTIETVIDYDIASVGTMFNRVEEEYYVLLYSIEVNGNDLDNVLSKYRSSDNYLKTYFINLDLKINNNVLGDELIKKPNNSKEVKVNGATLYKIKNSIVIDCISGVEEITNVLK